MNETVVKIEVWTVKCEECNNGQTDIYITLDENQGAYYCCNNCNAEYDKQVYSLPNAKQVEVFEKKLTIVF